MNPRHLGPITAVVLIAVAAWGLRACDPAPPAGVARGARLVFSDPFGGRALDPTNWITCYPWANPSGCTNAGNRELEWYTPANLSVSGGALHLTARRQDITAGGQRYRFTSGMVASARAFQFTYGYVQFRARPPAGDGLWSALWLLPANRSWPPEIDVLEVYGDDPSLAVLTYHPPHGPPAQRQVRVGDLSSGWHDFAVDWRPGSLIWFVDGHVRFRYEGTVPDQPMYLAMDLAVSRTHPPSSTTPASASLAVDQVRVWQPG
jgi:beta-glucanase (GH16 family)